MNKAICMQQVHGNNVVVVNSNSKELILDCDGLITNDPEVELIVETADCLPISIIDSDNKTIALIHAGWRGLQKKIIENTVSILSNNFNSKPKDLKVMIGPHICQKHYEVKDDVSSLFDEIVSYDNRKYLSLKDVAINQLVKLGIDINNIEVDPRCTFEDLSLASYRRGDRNKRFETRLSCNKIFKYPK